MSIRTILAAASGGTATTGAIRLACQLARRFSAHVEGYHVALDPGTMVSAVGDGLTIPSVGLIEDMIEEAKAKAAETRASFEEIIARHEIPRGGPPQIAPEGPSAGWREATGNASVMVAQRGRFFDLVVLGRSDRVVHEPHSGTVEEVLTRAGRPVLLAPATPPLRIGHVVALAWNGSPQSVRALAAALPFLEKADTVSLITAGDSERLGTPQALEYLAWHRIDAEHRMLPAGSTRNIGEMLIESARDACADLLVMGGYGHTPWRELLFGGATRAMVTAMPMPLLLVH